MGRDHHHAIPVRQFADQPQHLLHLDEVEVRGRFVGEDQRRIERDRAGDGNALLLSTAQVARPVFHPLVQVHPLEQFLGALARGPARHAGLAHRHHHVLDGGEARHQVERLEDDADLVAPVVRERRAVESRDVDVVELDCPDLGRSMPPRHDSNVVLPQPLGPSRITNDPAATSRFKPLIGCSAYPPL